MNTAAMNILVQVFCGHVFISLGSIPRSGMLGRRVGGQYRNPIDYVIRSRRWRSCIFSAKTRPGADCGTDHELFISNIRVKLKKLKEPECQTIM